MMINRALTFKLFRDLKQRLGTLIALLFVLAIGVGAYTSMASVYFDLDNARADYYQRYNLADFTIDLKRAPEAILYSLEHLPNILRLYSRVKTEVMVNLPVTAYSKNKQLLPGVAISLPVPRQNLVNNIKLIRGTWFSDSYAREVILNEQFAQAQHLNIGDRINVRLPEKEFDLLIVGTALSPEFTMILSPGGSIAPDPAGYAVMYMPMKFLQEYSSLNGSFNQLIGMTRDHSVTAINNTMTLLSEKLENYGVLFQTAQEDQTSVRILHDELVNVEKMTGLLPTMFLLVAALILNVMMNRLVTQQRIIIGTLKSVGYSNITLLKHYLGYGVVIGLIGGLLGIGLGFILQHLMLIAYRDYFAIPDISFHIYFEQLIIGILISIVSAMIGSLSGTYHAIKLSPAEAMRPAAPEIGTHILVEHFKVFWKRLSFQWKMVMRAIFRNRFRSLVTIAASMLATTLVFSSLQFLDAVNKMIDFSFDKMQHQDYTISLRDPLGQEVIRIANHIRGVKDVEGHLSVSSKLENGPRIKLMEVLGLPNNHSLFLPIDEKGNLVSIASSGLVINRTLANILHVKEGDTITFRPLIGNRIPTKIKIDKIFTTYLGLVAYADQTWLSHLIGNSFATNRLLVTLDKNANRNNFVEDVNQYGPVINLLSLSKAKALLIYTMNKFLVFFILIMIGFAGIIAIGSVINTAMISLNERERDVASLRVLGYSNWQVSTIFFGESIILNCFGIVIGLFTGIGYVYYISAEFSTEIFRMPAVIYLSRLFESAVIMIILVLISQGMIYRVITKMKWYDVLNARE